MSAPIYRDPIHDGAADPVIVQRHGTREWWMFYTNRRPAAQGAKRWIHGSPIGVAVSRDGGASWRYRGTVAGLDDPERPGPNTHWAPEVVFHDGLYHMFLTHIDGVPSSTTDGHPRSIIHLTSPDLVTWSRRGPLTLSSPRVIDACVFLSPGGLWRLWYKDEDDGASTWSAISPDLYRWTVEGRVLPGRPDAFPHEGPNVFLLGGWYWLIVDEWHGQAAYRSEDTVIWERQGIFGEAPGADAHDRRYVRHADVVVRGDRAALYYFTHPQWDEAKQPEGPKTPAERATSIHHGLLHVEDGRLLFERNIDADQALLRAQTDNFP